MLPTIGIVLLLSFTIAPIPPSILLLFLFGAAMLVVGMMFFTLGAELCHVAHDGENGSEPGSAAVQEAGRWFVLLVLSLLGFIITISEPDLQVLAEQVPVRSPMRF